MQKVRTLGRSGVFLEDPMGDIPFVVLYLDEAQKGKKEVIVPVSAFSQWKKCGSFVLEMNNDPLATAPEFKASI